jgi:hypothetical protein
VSCGEANLSKGEIKDDLATTIPKRDRHTYPKSKTYQSKRCRRAIVGSHGHRSIGMRRSSAWNECRCCVKLEVAWNDGSRFLVDWRVSSPDRAAVWRKGQRWLSMLWLRQVRERESFCIISQSAWNYPCQRTAPCICQKSLGPLSDTCRDDYRAYGIIATISFRIIDHKTCSQHCASRSWYRSRSHQQYTRFGHPWESRSTWESQSRLRDA